MIGIKDAARLTGIVIITFCAVLVCAMFLNYYMDILAIEDVVAPGQQDIFYQAQVSTAKVVCAVSGGCLLATSAVMLLFYIRHYIDTHKKELGILKAMGYSAGRIARHFCVFGASVFLGTALGFAGAFLLMPSFYELQNKDHFLPDISIHFHPVLLLYLIFLPTAAFALLSVLYARWKLKTPVLYLLRDWEAARTQTKKRRADTSERPFLTDLKKNTLRDNKMLVFFVLFASFCFSSMVQMSSSMRELSSEMMGAMMLGIGLVLACTTMLMALTTVIRGNTRTIAMMRVFGYSQKQCCHALLSGYRPVAYIGFAVGTAYQYMLLRIMVDIVFRDFAGMPTYEFDVPVMLRTLAVFAVVYELIVFVFSERIKKISVKEIMLES